MLSDAAVYAIALAAIGRSTRFKVNAARISGTTLAALALGLVAEAVRRFIEGGTPDGEWMIAISFTALGVNIYVLRILGRQRSSKVHMRTAWIFTRADVIANAAVILAGVAVLATGNRYFDLVVVTAIGLYVIRESLEILSEEREAGRQVR